MSSCYVNVWWNCHMNISTLELSDLSFWKKKKKNAMRGPFALLLEQRGYTQVALYMASVTQCHFPFWLDLDVSYLSNIYPLSLFRCRAYILHTFNKISIKVHAYNYNCSFDTAVLSRVMQQMYSDLFRGNVYEIILRKQKCVPANLWWIS